MGGAFALVRFESVRLDCPACDAHLPERRHSILTQNDTTSHCLPKPSVSRVTLQLRTLSKPTSRALSNRRNDSGGFRLFLTLLRERLSLFQLIVLQHKLFRVLQATEKQKR